MKRAPRRSPRRPPSICRLGLALGLTSIPLFSLGLPAAGAKGRLVLQPATVVVDQAIWICVDGAAAPEILHLDGLEEPPYRTEGASPAGSAPGRIHLSLPWPERGPLGLPAAIDPREREWQLPSWDDAGYLGVGEYVLSATGFEPETLRVVAPTPRERRSRAVLSRAWGHLARGDTLHAARLVEAFLDLEPASPYADQAFLAMLDVLPRTQYRDRPRDWLSEWVARQHSSCAVGAGIGRWLDRTEEESARRVLVELVAGYPQTRAAEAAEEWLRAGP